MRRFQWLVLFIVSTGLLAGCDFDFSSISDKNLSPEKARSRLADLVDDISWTQDFVQRRANVLLTKTNLLDTLPDIDQYGVVVEPQVSGGVEVEIFASSEKAGKGSDGWLVEVVKEFNQQRFALANGKVAQVRLRKIASGTGAQFIAARKHIPQAYTPSNVLWIKMIEAQGIPVHKVRDRLVGNVGGIVMKKNVAATLREQYSTLDVSSIIDAVAQGKLITGYTNPYASSTGLNFLVSVLNAFADSTDSNMLRPDVVSSFESFQRNVPFVAMTTLQMRDSVQNNGVLDAFVMEWQTFSQTQPPMSAEYEFIPFGIRHDNPLYAVGDVTEEQKEALELLARHAESNAFTTLANNYGFNDLDDYSSSYDVPDGTILANAQKVWKEKKDAGRPITSVFLVDVSGSMSGQRIKAVRQALIGGADFIATHNSIGLVTFQTTVNVVLPPKPFDLRQKSAFWAAVEDLETEGNTAMYNGIAVSLQLLLEQRKANPDSRLMLFVLTDGETNKGLKFGKLEEVIRGVGIPIYTIGYAEQIAELKQISALVEAASMNASQGDVGYKIGNLLNAQM